MHYLAARITNLVDAGVQKLLVAVSTSYKKYTHK